MRREIFRLEPVDQGEGRNSFRLPFLCGCCTHASEASPMEHGKMFCVQGLELPAYGGFCHGFTRTRKTDSNERPQKALPFDALCSIVKAPNLTSPDRRLALATQPAKALCTSNQTIGLAAHAVKVLSILAGLQCPGTREDPAASLEPGSIASLPFLFPRSNEVHNV